MTEWQKVKLGDICETQYGYTASAETVDTGTKFLRITDIVPDTIDWDSVPFCKISNEERAKYILRKGDIVVARTGATVGYAKYIKNDVESVFASYLVRFKVIDDKADKEYVGLCVTSKTFKDYILSIANGSAQPNANSQMMSSFELALPPLNVQRRIAEVLSRYDALIENYQRQIKLLEEAAQRLYKEWFVDLRFPGHQSTPIINNLPQSWQKKKLGEIFTFIRGKSYTSKELSDEGTLLVNLKNIQAFGGYKREAEKRFTGDYKIEQSLYKGDLIMGVTDMTQERRLVGHVALVPDFNEPATFSMDLIKILPFELPNVFLYCAMRFGGISTIISPLANGVNVLHLKPDAMMSIEMTIPSNDLIMRFTTYATSCIEEINKLENQIRNLSEARDRLLPKLMSGEA